MLSLNGVIIQGGLQIGKARKISPHTWDIKKKRITQHEIGSELQNLQNAIVAVEQDIERHLKELQGNEEDKDILRTHLLILQDPMILPRITEAIGSNLLSAAQAVLDVFREVVAGFNNLDSSFFAQRSADYRDVQQRLLAELTGLHQDDLENWQPDQIAVLNDITPSQVSGFARHHIPGYCAEQGSFTSHASILTRSLHITAVTAAPSLFSSVNDGDSLILDAIGGHIIVNPDPGTIQLYEQLNEKYAEQETLANQDRDLPTQTKDGKRIKLRCNLDLISEVDQPSLVGADGIGLYRTEFLYLGKKELPSEELQYSIYREAAEKVAPQSVTIRSFDLGGDKLSHLIPSPVEENPYLGSRGIRFSLAHPDIFRTQIRAVLRASHYGRIKLMFPMVADLRDFQKAKEVVESCEEELKKENIPYADNLPLGVMIEVPSAALQAEELARACDFLSIGTNDLVQYTLAADRNNSALSDYYTTHHPAVLNLLNLTLHAGEKYGKPVSVCGEMASQAEYLPLLIGMGFTELSIGASSFHRCKSIIRRCDAHLRELVSQIEPSQGLTAIEHLIFEKLKPYYEI
jgi:phosphoenolpyruvate-protein phosphotransferase (PTS system enzyme I)